MAETGNPAPNRNRKRKKTFLKNARKYGKKGCYGRGVQLDADTYQYFIRIMEAYREGFDTEEDKLIFVNNVFDQTVNEEINCCQNQVGCRVIETLLPFANASVVERFMEAFGSDLRPLCADRFASHVLEALVRKASKDSLNTEVAEDQQQKCKDFTLKVSKFLINNIEDYLEDTYGNHVMRTCLESLVRIPPEDNKGGHKKQEPGKDVKVELPDEYKEVVKHCGERLIAWPHLKDLCRNEICSGFLQVLLRALREIEPKLVKKYLKKFLEEVFASGHGDGEEVDANKIPSVFLCKATMMLLETSLAVANSKLYTQIYAKCFLGRLNKLATTRMTNFAVQKLLIHCSEKVEFEAMFDELSDHFKEIISQGHTGVIMALGQACKRLMAKQGPFYQNLVRCLNCEAENRQTEFIVCLARFKPYEDSIKLGKENLHKEKLNLHGTLLLQLLLEFNKPIKSVNALLSMETNDLKNLFSNTMGSHIVDSFVSSPYVGEKSREKLIRKMKGTYQDLASTKYGSRSFEAIWKAAEKFRQTIMDELSYKDGAWSNSEHGKIIASKVNLALYKRNKEDWKNSLSKTSAKELFADILK